MKLLISLLLCLELGFAIQDILLNQFPFLMSHDAATGEIIEARDHIIAAYSKTQPSGLVEQLNCGARSFDYRPLAHEGNLFAHHGNFKILKPMKESMMEIMRWCDSNPDDLVLVYLSHYEGDDNCKDLSIELMKSLNIMTVSNCDDLSTLSYKKAYVQSRLRGGGHLMALFDCVDEEFDPKVNCYGKGYSCYDSWPENSSSIPWETMENYIYNVTKRVPVSDGQLWMTQAHWQSSTVSVPLGILHNSTVLKDEERSSMNIWIAAQISEKKLPFLNIVEVDNVCDHGLDIYNALLKYRS